MFKKWKAALVLVIIYIATAMGWNWVWGVLFLSWTIPSLYSGAIDADVDSGVEHGCELVGFAAALMKTDTAALTAARDAVAEQLGPEAVTTASIIVGNFGMLDRVANAIGISVDAMILKPTADFREELGINSFPSAVNTLG